MRATIGARWIAVAAFLAVPALASAGVVITDGKTGVSTASSTTSSTVRVAVQTCPATGCPVVVSTGNSTTNTVVGGNTGTTTIALTPYDLKQIQDGVVTSSEAQQGCTTGRSPAAALPLVLVGLALLAARRKR